MADEPAAAPKMTWGDYLFLAVFLAIIGALIYGITLIWADWIFPPLYDLWQILWLIPLLVLAPVGAILLGAFVTIGMTAILGPLGLILAIVLLVVIFSRR